MAPAPSSDTMQTAVKTKVAPRSSSRRRAAEHSLNRCIFTSSAPTSSESRAGGRSVDEMVDGVMTPEPGQLGEQRRRA